MGLSKADERRLAFEPYLRELADLLRLRDWTVEVTPDPPGDGGDLCHVVPTYGRKYAVVRLSDSFLVLSPKEQRQSLVHELIHCHLDAAGATALDNVPEPVKGVYRRLLEYAVDGLADAIAPLLPLRPEGPQEAAGEPVTPPPPVSPSQGQRRPGGIRNGL